MFLQTWETAFYIDKPHPPAGGRGSLSVFFIMFDKLRQNKVNKVSVEDQI